MNDLILTQAMRDDHISKQLGHCVNCKERWFLHQMKFTYSEGDIEKIRYNVRICHKCYKSKIEGKPLDELKLHIPLLLMKRGRVELATKEGTGYKVYNIGV